MSKTQVLYSIASYVAFLIALVFVLPAPMLIASGWASDGSFSLWTGQPRVILPTGAPLSIRLNQPASRLELRFRHPLQSISGTRKGLGRVVLEQPEAYPKVLIITLAETGAGTPVGAADIPFEFSLSEVELFQNLPPAERVLESALINDTERSGLEFYHQDIDQGQSSLDVHYPRAISSISSYLANQYGMYLINGIAGMLISLLGVQLFLLLLRLKWGPIVEPGSTHSELNVALNPTVIDRVCIDWAIPLGLMGTIGSIWVSLEEPGLSLAGFERVLEILQLAVFTTVLGFSTRLLVSFRTSMMSEIDEKP